MPSLNVSSTNRATPVRRVITIPIFKCPNCEEEIEYLNYSVRVYETGSASIRNYDDRITLDDHETDDSDWDGSPDYQCPECNHDLNAEEIILEDNQDEDEPEEIKPEPEEPNDAIESKTKLIIRHKENRPKSIDMSDLGICVCKDCNHTFIPEPSRKGEYDYSDKDDIVFCPKCMSIIVKKENMQTVLNNTIYDNSNISA